MNPNDRYMEAKWASSTSGTRRAPSTIQHRFLAHQEKKKKGSEVLRMVAEMQEVDNNKLLSWDYFSTTSKMFQIHSFRNFEICTKNARV